MRKINEDSDAPRYHEQPHVATNEMAPHANKMCSLSRNKLRQKLMWAHDPKSPWMHTRKPTTPVDRLLRGRTKHVGWAWMAFSNQDTIVGNGAMEATALTITHDMSDRWTISDRRHVIMSTAKLTPTMARATEWQAAANNFRGFMCT